MSDFTQKELSDIALAAAKEAARQTISETFALLGVNVSNFDSMQGLRDDLAFLRHTRVGAGRMGAKFVLTIVSVIAGAVAIGAWEYLKFLLHVAK